MDLASKKDIYTTLSTQEKIIAEKLIQYLGISFPMTLKNEPQYFFIETEEQSIVVDSPHIYYGALKFRYVSIKTKINKYLDQKFVLYENSLFVESYFSYNNQPFKFSMNVNESVNLFEKLSQLQALVVRLERTDKSKMNGFDFFEDVCSTLDITSVDIIKLEVSKLIKFDNQKLDCVLETHRSFSVYYYYGFFKYTTKNSVVELSLSDNNCLSIRLNGKTKVLEALSLKTLIDTAHRRSAVFAKKVNAFNGKL